MIRPQVGLQSQKNFFVEFWQMEDLGTLQNIPSKTIWMKLDEAQ